MLMERGAGLSRHPGLCWVFKRLREDKCSPLLLCLGETSQDKAVVWWVLPRCSRECSQASCLSLQKDMAERRQWCPGGCQPALWDVPTLGRWLRWWHSAGESWRQCQRAKGSLL